MKKGQITIEYLLILLVLLILFTGVSTDLMTFTSRNSLQMQTEEISRAHNATINNVVDSISLQAPGAHQKIMLTAPADCAYNITTFNITLQCTGDTPSENYTGRAIGIIETSQNVEYNQNYIEPAKTGYLDIERS